MGRLQTVVSALSASSLTIFAAGGAGIRWKLTYACITPINTVATASISLYQQASGTTSTVTLIFGYVVGTQVAPFQMDIADYGGFTCEAANTRLFINTDGALRGIFLGETW